MEAAPAPIPDQPQATAPQIATIDLDVPISRASGDIAKVALRRPQPREVEGLNLRDLANMEAGPVMRLLPRITDPMLMFHEVATMDISDLTQMAAEVSNFLLPKSHRIPST